MKSNIAVTNEAAPLSPRETEIITMIAQGLQVPKIAEFVVQILGCGS